MLQDNKAKDSSTSIKVILPVVRLCRFNIEHLTRSGHYNIKTNWTNKDGITYKDALSMIFYR